MVELLLPENKNRNTLQLPPLPEPETTDLAAGKRTMNSQKIPLHKRCKTSSLQTPNEGNLEGNESRVPNSYNALNEPGLLGLNLKKSGSLLDLIQAKVSEAHIVRSKKDDKARVRISGPVDNLKASNFPALLLKIGKWQYVSKYEGDLVAKCYFAKHKLVWEVLDGGLKNKIEIEWEAIVGLKANCPDNGPGTLTIVLGKQPLFFRETNPQPRKHTVWQATTDFTDGEASTYRQHYLQCAQGVLNKHYKKLINCDTRLKLLSQQAGASSDLPPAAKDTVRDPNHNGYGLAKSWDLVRSKAIELVNAAWPQQTMSIPGIINHTAHCVSHENLPLVNNAAGEVNQNQLVEDISTQISQNNDIIPSDEESPMSVSNDNSVPDARNCRGQEWNGVNDHFTPYYLAPENGNGMLREDDSYTNLLDQLPQIESLPRLFYDTSQDGDMMNF